MIGILYESREWSSTALGEYIREEGIDTKLFDLEQEIEMEEILSCGLLINRVFASAQFRDHNKSLENVQEILDKATERKIPLINSRNAHYYETSKILTYRHLSEAGFLTPEIYDFFNSSGNPDYSAVSYPCILKPNCGGRTLNTFFIENQIELEEILDSIDYEIDFILQKYIRPVRGYVTRIEVIGNKCDSIMKRSVVDGGLSAYALGSQYLDYDDCAEEIKEAAVDIMKHTGIDMGSLDIIESENGFYIIDVNSVSNFEPENIEMFGYNLIKDMAEFVAFKYQALIKENKIEYQRNI